MKIQDIFEKHATLIIKADSNAMYSINSAEKAYLVEVKNIIKLKHTREEIKDAYELFEKKLCKKHNIAYPFSLFPQQQLDEAKVYQHTQVIMGLYAMVVGELSTLNVMLVGMR